MSLSLLTVVVRIVEVRIMVNNKTKKMIKRKRYKEIKEI